MAKCTETTPEERVTHMSKTKKIRSDVSMDPEARTQRLIARAFDLVEQRLIDGTATSAETVHFLKLANKEQKLKEKMIERQSELMDAKVGAIRNAESNKELAERALNAMRQYSPTKDD